MTDLPPRPPGYNIFDRLDVAYDDFGIPSPFRLGDMPEHKGKREVWSFPQPGAIEGDDVSGVVASAEGLTFPRYGSWRVMGGFGVAKLLLLDPAWSPEETIRAFTAFASEHSWHSAQDTYLCFRPGERNIMRPERSSEKLFHSDQPLGLHCGHIADLLAWYLKLHGFESRKVVLVNDQNIGHIYIETYAPTLDRWIYLDPDFGVMLQDPSGEWIGSDEVLAAKADGRLDDIVVIDVGNKNAPKHEHNFNYAFSGQLAWRPEMMTNRSFALSPYFRDTVLDRGMQAVRRYGYVWPTDAENITIRSRPLTTT